MKKITSFLLTGLLLLLFNGVVWGQPWTYNFGTGTGTFTSSTPSTAFLPAPPSGTARVRVGTNPGSIVMANPGLVSLGTGTELQITSNTGSTSTTKFSVYDYTSGKTGYVKFKIAFSGGTNGVYKFSLGDGASFSDNNAMATNQIFAGIEWTLGSSNTISYKVLNASAYGTTGISDPTTLFVQNTSIVYEIEIFANNNTSSANYFRSGNTYSIANATWDLWVDGTLIGNDLAKGGIGSNVTFDSYSFNHQNNVSAPGTIYIDDIEYSNSLPYSSEPTTQASAINFPSVGTTGFTINWTNGDGASRAVFMKQGSGVITEPSDGTAYTASADWDSKGTQLGSSGYYCVYNGGSNSVAITNLLASTEYTVQVFEYNGSGATANYFTSTATDNPKSQTTNAATSPTLTIAADPALTEANLDGAEITLTLTNDTFADATFANGNFTLNNTPAGVTVGSVVHNSSTTATLTLAYNDTDFDGNVTTFNITIAAAELTGGNPLTSNNLTITAVIETAPTVTTDAAITTPGSSTATWGGEVTADGGESVTQKGMVWNTSTEPTIALDTKTEEGSGIGDITGNMTGLTPNTLYYVRAYAINSVGTSYGDEETFTTENLPAPTANAATQISSTGFTANWDVVTGASSYRLDVSQYLNFQTPGEPASDLFISEYCEGSSNNKYIEIFNSTGETVDLSNYTLKQAYNGSGWDYGISYTLPLSGTLQNNNVYVICNSSAIQEMKNKANLLISYNASTQGGTIVSFTGNDAMGLFKNGELIDLFGDPSSSSTISIAGGSYGDNHTMVRKPSIKNGNTNWISSSGTNADNSEWIVNNLDYYSDLGEHTMDVGSTPSFVTDYNNRTVNLTTENITELTAGTTYYYRVRGFSDASTSDNSSTITVTTAASTQTNPVVGTGAQNVTVSGTTGVGNINFTNVTTPGDILVSNFNNAPASHGLDGNVSNYRWVIEPGSGLAFNQGEGYTLRFEVANCPGIDILDDLDNTTLQLYKRSTPGTGAFEGPIALTYRTNGTPQQSDDYLLSALITTGFSEFVFQSPSQPLPIELSSFSALPKANGVQLTWATATEINNFGFEIERSQKLVVGSESTTWQSIGFVKGNGNSNSPREYSYTDNTLNNSGKYIYRLKQIDNDGTVTYSNEIETDVTVVLEYGLSQNYPNPFNPATVINYTLAEPGFVTIKVYNMLGEEVTTLINGQMEAGKHTLQFDGHNLSSGMYLYKITAGNFTQVKKMLLTK